MKTYRKTVEEPQLKLKDLSVSELMSRADNFDLFFYQHSAEVKAKEIEYRNKLATIKKTRDKFIVFEFKKII